MRNKNIVDDENVYVNGDFANLPLFVALTEKSVIETPADPMADWLEDGVAGDALSALDQKILCILRDRSHEEALRGPDLCCQLGIDPDWNGQRKLRTHISGLVRRGFPIGSDRAGQHRGFFWLTKPEDREAAANHLRSQARKLWQRAARLDNKHAIAEDWGQQRLAG